jgi:hypothetical protein
MAADSGMTPAVGQGRDAMPVVSVYAGTSSRDISGTDHDHEQFVALFAQNYP